MEYLMTYGWAVLLVAVVLVAMFSLGVFGSNVASSCLPSSGYLCSNPILSAATGNLIVNVGQFTGINWVTANVLFLQSPSQYGLSNATPNNYLITDQYAVNPLVPVGGYTSTSTSTSSSTTTVLQSSTTTANSQLPAGIFTSNNETEIPNGLSNGGSESISIPVNVMITGKPVLRIGQALSGTIWAQYTLKSNPGIYYYVQIAEVTIIAS